VGHQPDLGEWTAWLIGSKKAHIDLAKAGVAFLACPDGTRKGGGSLVWLVTPDWYVIERKKAAGTT
jgi:phosphohistidine phosphatase SixA